MPDGMTDAEQRAWEFLQRELTGLGLWSSTYATTCELFARTYVRWRDLDSDVKRNGPILVTPLLSKGRPVVVEIDGKMRRIEVRSPNPAQREWAKLLRELRGLCGDLGLNPSALSKLKNVSGSGGDALDDFGVVA